MNNTLLILDLITGSLNVMARANELLLKAASENRDVSDDELGALKSEADALEKSIIDG